MSAFHLAQMNTARLRAPLEDPSMADFVEGVTLMNDLADRSPGFVWRLADENGDGTIRACLLYTSPSPRDQRGTRMPSSA